MRWFLSLCVLLFCSTASASLIHSGSANPATEGWTYTKPPAGYAGSDHWVTDTMGYSQWQPTVAPSAADFSGDWFLIVDARWVDGPKAESRATIMDGFHKKSTALTWNSTAAYYYQAGAGDTAFPGVDPKLRHEYRVDYKAADELMTFSVDGSVLVTLESYQQNTTTGAYMLYWGDNTSQLPPANHSKMEWYGVGFNAVPVSVPEPAVWILLSMVVGVGLIVYGWRKFR